MDKKIRVAFWHNVFSPYRVPVFQKLAAYDDIDLTVYYGSEKDSHRAWNVDFESGYTYVVLPSLALPWYPYKFNYSLLSTLLRARHDVYIAPEHELGSQITYLAARLRQKPFMIWSLDITYQIIRDRREYTWQGCLQKIPPYLKRQAQRLLFFPFRSAAIYIKRHADACLTAGQKTEEHLRTIGAKGQFFRFGNSVDTIKFRHQLQQQDVSTLKQIFDVESKKVILSISYLQKRKGIQYLIEAFLALQRNDAVLLIVGDGEYKRDLMKFVPEGCSNVRFLGHDEETAKYYAIADMFVMPSFSDPWGLTVNEAMLAGLPVITTSNVGAQELIQGNGFVIPPRDSHALKICLERLLEDDSLRVTMGKRSLEIINAYTIDHIAEVCREAIHYCDEHAGKP